MKLKRLSAYIIDLFIVSLITELILCFPFFGNTKEAYMEASAEYYNMVLNSTSGSSDIDENEEIEKTYEMQRSAQTINIITIGCLFLYFGVAGYIAQGQTIGKKILKLKIVPAKGNELKPHLFILRTIIITNIIPRIAMVLLTSFLTMNDWFKYSVYVAQGQYIIIFLIIGFMIFREDERGLHDILCNTKVISTKE